MTLYWWWEIDFKSCTWRYSRLTTDQVQVKSLSESVILRSRPDLWTQSVGVCDPNLERGPGTWDRSVPVRLRTLQTIVSAAARKVKGWEGALSQGREVAWARAHCPQIFCCSRLRAELKYFVRDCEIVFRHSSLPDSLSWDCLHFCNQLSSFSLRWWRISMFAQALRFNLDHRQHQRCGDFTLRN